MKIKVPTLLVNESICRNNIRKMANKAETSGCIFRPHFKTHQSAEIGNWFADEGVSKITVSSVEMAGYFAQNGWNDILIAFPFNIHEIDAVSEMSKKILIHLTVESEFTIKHIEQKLTGNAGIYIKIDAGYNRTGLIPGNISEIEKILRICENSSKLIFKGFLAHFGNTYNAKNKDEVIKIYNESIEPLTKLKKQYINQFPDLLISIGDTPSCSLMKDLSAADEIRPGNFVFYDLMQLKLEACQFEDIAVAMACPVVAKHSERNEIVIYGGAVHFSKDYLIDESGKAIYGQVVELTEHGWSEILTDTNLVRLSQEHGVIQCPEKIHREIDIGDVLGIIPVHSCLSANLQLSYLTLHEIILPNIHNTW